MKKIIKVILNLIYPNVCGICDCLCEDDICKKCNIKLNKIAKFKIDRYKDKNFKLHFYVFKYSDIIKEKLISYKFNEKTYIYKSFVNFCINNKKFCEFIKTYDIIIPVPIHKKRKLERGYNQSAILAKAIAKKFDNLEYNDKILLKKINNKPQSTKNKEERIINVKNVYDIKNNEDIINKNIIIIDDIFTTGNTLNECAKMVKKLGPKKIDVITISKD